MSPEKETIASIVKFNNLPLLINDTYKMTKAIFLALLLITSTAIITVAQDAASHDPLLDYVDPFIGTGGHGHTFPGATVPFGMMQLSPDTRLTGWDGCSGYHYTDTIVYGFSHTHLSGTGVSDYGDLLLMPYTGATIFNNGADGSSGYSSPFQKENEKASPGYYQTTLDKYGIEAELTTSTRAGMHKYTFKDDNTDQQLIIDLVHRDKVLDAHINITSPTTIEGYRHSDAWARDQRFFFAIEFNRPILSQVIEIDGKGHPQRAFAKNTALKAALNFGSSDEPLLIKVGISAVDIKGAKQNLADEISHWDLQRVKQEAAQKWSAELGKIRVLDSSESKKTIFYTALYHTMIAPNIYSDSDGRYRGMDLEIHRIKDKPQYTVFSLWDTYRAAHPLYTIIDHKRTNAFVQSFLNQYQQGGSLPMWELAGNYTGCMIGYHAVPVISDAFMKDINDYDTELALEAMMANANANKLGIPSYVNNGFLSTATESESVSKTLEYAYDDWTIAQMAEKMGKAHISDNYYKRSQNYKNMMDPSTGFMRARANNRWFHPFDPAEVNFNYTEANAWQYSFYAPQDVEGWIELIGGETAAEAQLDALFTAPEITSGRNQVDITGLIGQYAHGNEPSHHIAYLYNYLGKPYKTQKYVRQIMSDLYHNDPNGLSGNEDCGQMSAWLVMSALGFYPVTPGSNDYILGSPWFDKVEINLENGKTVHVNAINNSDENIYVQYMYLAKSYYDQSYITHELLMTGPELNFTMGAEPALDFASSISALPLSNINAQEVTAVPALVTGDRSFDGSTQVSIATITPDATIHYQINNTKAKVYDAPFTISNDCKITSWATKEHAIDSKKGVSHFIKRATDKTLNLRSAYASQYSAGGDAALLDRIRGGADYRSGNWQGYEGTDIELIIDLDKKTKVNEIRMGFLQDENSWIFMPTQLSVYTGEEGDWKLYGSLENDRITPKDKGTIVKDFVVRGKAKTRQLRIVAKSLGTCPDFHKGAGYSCWLFSDEVIVK